MALHDLASSRGHQMPPTRMYVNTALLLPQATDAAAAAYCPSRKELCAAAGIADADLLLLEPDTTTTRPAYAVWVDAPNKRLVWGFRGTTDLNVSGITRRDLVFVLLFVCVIVAGKALALTAGVGLQGHH
jgi:hypothetical protein